MLFYRYLKK